jgi:hypothetical protein
LKAVEAKEMACHYQWVERNGPSMRVFSLSPIQLPSVIKSYATWLSYFFNVSFVRWFSLKIA